MINEEFEWDDDKAASNLHKHGVSFDMAEGAFRDPFAIEWLDISRDAGEHRYALLGTVDGKVLFVAYALRQERIRIISARGATRYERKRYHEENAD
jgi:uncharacterized DUF497 family protein